MGKKRAGKDRAYLTNTEWREEHGGCAWLRWGGGFWLPFGGGGLGRRCLLLVCCTEWSTGNLCQSSLLPGLQRLLIRLLAAAADTSLQALAQLPRMPGCVAEAAASLPTGAYHHSCCAAAGLPLHGRPSLLLLQWWRLLSFPY